MDTMNNYWTQIRRMAAILPCLFAFAFATPVLAQSEPSEPVPQPAPSIEDFSLTPGSSSPAPAPAPTGPVDETAPTTVTTPAPTQPSVTEPADTPEPIVPSNLPAIVPESSSPNVQSQTPAVRTPPPAPVQTRAPAQQERQQETLTPQEEAGSEASGQEEPATQTSPTPLDPSEQSNSIPTDIAPTEAEQPSDQSTLYLGAAVIVILLGGFGLVLWRRREKVRQAGPALEAALPISEPKAEEETETPTQEPAPAPVQAATNPVSNKKRDIRASRDGFVTSKIGKSEPAAKPNPTSTPLSDQLSIDFQVKSASSTLINAVVEYRIKIENRSGQPLTNLHISGTMIQADKDLVETAASSQGQLLHELGSLAAGQSEQASGAIRLPLTAFQPIDFQSQKLFVPLVLLRFDYLDSDGNAHMQAANYLVGTEHVPPREKMAPFRLDLGPRNFGSVAHRPFQS